jgi:hypothetical protein
MLLPDPTSSWLFKPINSRILSKDAMFDENPSRCKLWPKLFFSLLKSFHQKRARATTGRFPCQSSPGCAILRQGTEEGGRGRSSWAGTSGIEWECE